MERIMIRYTVKPDSLAEHLELLGDVYAELEATQPDGFRYVTFRLDDERSFMDLALGAGLPGPLGQLESFRRYRTGLEQRCEERVATEIHEVNSFRFHPEQAPSVS